VLRVLGQKRKCRIEGLILLTLSSTWVLAGRRVKGTEAEGATTSDLKVEAAVKGSCLDLCPALRIATHQQLTKQHTEKERCTNIKVSNTCYVSLAVS
jgi:hypothetical protein